MKQTLRSQPRWAANLRALMQAGGFNPRSLSLKAGLNPTAVRDMLEGRTRFPRYDTVQALAEALGTTPAQLMGGEPKNAAPLKSANNPDNDLDLLTEIIARLQEVAAEYTHPLNPRDFAGIVTAIYRQLQGSKPRKAAAVSLRPKICNLLEYEALRRRSRR